jgi:hypothetical protein
MLSIAYSVLSAVLAVLCLSGAFVAWHMERRLLAWLFLIGFITFLTVSIVMVRFTSIEQF